jgi:hypothetical protein
LNRSGVEETLPEVLAEVPYLEDDLPVTVYHAKARNEYTIPYEEMEELRQDWGRELT